MLADLKRSHGGLPQMKRWLILALTGIGVLFAAHQSFGFPDGVEQSGPESQTTATFKVSQSLILDIAKRHPRFAATLANQNIYGFELGKSEVNWTPIELACSEIPAFLNKAENKAFFDRYNEKAKEINRQVEAGKGSMILYEMNVSEASPHDVVLELDVVKGFAKDPPYKSLVLTISGVNPNEKFEATRDNTHWFLK